jgi:DamX protein
MQAQHENLLNEELSPHLAKLGLLSEPFADAPSGHFFYVGADGEQRLDLMHHLAPYSPLLVIIGELGVGKTALLQQFMARAKDNWRITVVTARLDMDRDDFMASMSESLGLPSQSQIDPQAQYLSLIAQFRALRQTAQVPILLIDDAQNLSVSLLELIHKLCSENDDGHILSVILFGTPQLQSLWTKPSLMPLAARITHTFEVTPYTEEETARYIRHRLRAAGASDDGPFDSVAINKIHAASGGIPSRINELAQQELMDWSMGSARRQTSSVQGGAKGADRRRWGLLLAGLVVLVLLVAGPLRSVLFESSPLPSQDAQQTRALSLPPSPPPPQPGSVEERVVRSDDIATAPAAVPPPPLPVPPANEAPPSSSDSSGAVKTIPLPPEGSTTISGSALAEPSPAPEKPAQPSTAATATPKTQVAVKPAVPPQPPAKKSEAVQIIKRAVDGSEWLKAQADNNFTLQLMAVKEENTARQFIETHQLHDKAAYFPVTRNGQTLYAVVYGSFSQRSEAAQAAKSLPAAWGSPSPWIRSFKSLHAVKP